VIIGLLSAAHGLSYHDALKKRPWLRMLRASFFGGDAPLDMKLAVLLVLLLLVRWAGYLLLRHALRMVRGVAQRDPVATSAAVSLAALVLATLLDRSASVLAVRFDMQVGASVDVLFRTLEEVAELALPLIALLALCQRKYLRPLAAPAAA